MAESALRTLSLLTHLSAGPQAVTRLAEALGVDKSGVSRTLAALAESGWVSRVDGGYALGPQALLLGTGPVERGYLERSDQLARALSRVTGLTVMVTALAGTRQYVVARAAGGRGEAFRVEPAEHYAPWSTASGIASLAQLARADVERLLGAAPDRAEVQRLVEEARDGQAVLDRGWSVPGARCLALPHPGPYGAPGSIAVLGFEGMHPERLADAELQLRAAAAPGATPDSILRSARQQLAPDATPPRTLVDAVGQALRGYHRPAVLADSPLAPLSGSSAERARAVRARLHRAWGSAFGETAHDVLLRTVVELAYLDPEAGHTRAMRTLHLSRTTYYRRLSEATGRLIAHLAEEELS